MNDKDYQEIGETIGAVIGCFIAVGVVVMFIAALVALPFMLIGFLTGTPSVI